MRAVAAPVGRAVADAAGAARAELLRNLISGEQRPQDPRTSSERSHDGCTHQPPDESQWMTVTAEALVLRRRAYWLSLQGRDEVPGQQSVTVRIPEHNVFDVEALQTLIEQSRNGEI